MRNDSTTFQTSLMPPQPIPECSEEFTNRVHGLLDGKTKDDATVAKALEGMDTMLDLIAARMYNLASMLVGEGEDGVQLVETAVATAEVAGCQDAVETRQSSRKALAREALKLLARRAPGSLAAPEGIEPSGGCIEEDDLEAAGVSQDDLERMFAGPDRQRVRDWLEKLPADLRTVFVLRAVADFSATDTARMLAEYGGPKSEGWNAAAVRAVFRQGLCSLASQLVRAGNRD